jgi:hypothetical protein
MKCVSIGDQIAIVSVATTSGGVRRIGARVSNNDRRAAIKRSINELWDRIVGEIVPGGATK